jgi:Lrp/AsnC family leucine-responsive transcriptional regulator
MDEIDLEILQILQKDGPVSKAEIGRRIELAPSAVASRLERLEKLEVLRGFQVIVDHQKLGLDLLAFIFVTDDKKEAPRSVIASLCTLNIAEEVHRISGDDCYLLKVRAANTADLRQKLDLLNQVPTINSVRSHIALESLNLSAEVNYKWQIVRPNR